MCRNSYVQIPTFTLSVSIAIQSSLPQFGRPETHTCDHHAFELEAGRSCVLEVLADETCTVVGLGNCALRPGALGERPDTERAFEHHLV